MAEDKIVRIRIDDLWRRDQGKVYNAKAKGRGWLIVDELPQYLPEEYVDVFSWEAEVVDAD